MWNIGVGLFVFACGMTNSLAYSSSIISHSLLTCGGIFIAFGCMRLLYRFNAS